MFLAYVTALASVSVILASAVSVPHTGAGKCHTIDSGYLSVFNFVPEAGVFKALDLNRDKELTFKNGVAVKAAFQACPKATQNPKYVFTGRLVVEPISSNKCLTITNPSSPNGPYFVKANTCSSDTKPSTDQLWGYGTDDENFIFWTRGCDPGPGPGIALKSFAHPKLASRNRIELLCTGRYEAMILQKTKG